jgi:hypothetical protein
MWRSLSTRVFVRYEERLDQRHEVGSRERFFQKMDGAEAGDLFAFRAEMNRGENDRAGIRMTRAQIVDELLRQIVGRVHVENEERWLLVEDELLRFA